jgi:hypothetical protein
MGKSIEELLADCSHVYSHEQFDANYKRVVTRICEKHGITYGEVQALIRGHRYAHDAEDIEQEYIEIMAFARHAGWTPRCPRCNQHFSDDHLCSANHEDHCDIRMSRDGWDANCSCKRGWP